MVGNESAGERTAQRLADLLTHPREDLNIEIKGWLDLDDKSHQADLAKALLALANSGGGYVVFGFTERESVYVAELPRPIALSRYNQDAINGIVQSYAHPPFHCQLHRVSQPGTGDVYPVVVVPSGHRVPIRSVRDGPDQKHVRMNTYYIRRPGPKSEPPQTAQEWDDLIARCVRMAREELLDSIRDVLLGVSGSVGVAVPATVEGRLARWIEESTRRFAAKTTETLQDERPSRYARGYWTVAYAVSGDFAEPNLGRLLQILHDVQGHETGWPPWWVPTRDEIRPYPSEGVIECWLGAITRAASDSDFWCASPKGMLFLLRGYDEDDMPDKVEPGAMLDFSLPLYRVGECLLHAERFALALAGESATVAIRVTWSGLRGRTLGSLNMARFPFFRGRGAARQDAVTAAVSVDAGRIGETLPEIVWQLTHPLYEIFEFTEIPMETVEREVKRMKNREW